MKAPLAFTVVVGLALVPTASASTFSGRVTDGSAGVAGVDLDVFVAGTDNVVPTVNDNTDANGFFSFDLPNGLYDVCFVPPAASRLLETTRTGIAVNGATNIATVVLASGFFVSGTLIRQGGTPASGVSLRCADAATGDLFTPRSHVTAQDGSFTMVVPAGTWILQVRPDKATRLVAQEIQGIVLGPDRNLGTLILEAGWRVAMTVRRTNGTGVEGVDIDVDRVSPPGRVYTPGDDTGATGFVEVIAPPGDLTVNVGPDPSTRLVAQRFPLTLTGDTLLPDVVLQSGFFLSGRLLGPSGAVAGADVDVDNAFTGARIPTEADDSDSSGFFRVVVPAGSFNVVFQPPVILRLVGQRLLKVDVASDRNLGTISLSPGVLLSGIVRRSSGQPLAGVDMDLYDSGDAEIPAITDHTLADGSYAIVVAPGATDVVADVGLDDGLRHVTVMDLPVAADTVLDLTLLEATIALRLSLDEVGVPRGDFLHYSIELRNHATSPQSGLLGVEASAQSGQVRRTLLSPTRVDLAASSGRVSFGSFQRRVPHVLPPRLLRVPVTVTATVTDLSGVVELDRDIQQFYAY
jgi:hypothetical protein